MWPGMLQKQKELLNSHYDDEKKRQDLDKYVVLHNEQYTIIESMVDYGYSGMDDSTKAHHFL